jgi:gamma-glutamylcysteine synthetase
MVLQCKSHQEGSKIARGIAKKGKRPFLRPRNFRNVQNKTESSFPAVLDETVTTGETQADQLLDLYHDSWTGDVPRVLKDFAR